MTNIEGFIDDVLGQAEWRSRKAAEYPGDDRNVSAAEGLRGLAAWLRGADSLSRRAELDQALDQLYADPDDAISMVPNVSEILGRFRFDDPDQPFEDFIDDLIETIEKHMAIRVSAESSVK